MVWTDWIVGNLLINEGKALLGWQTNAPPTRRYASIAVFNTVDSTSATEYSASKWPIVSIHAGTSLPVGTHAILLIVSDGTLSVLEL
jgi:hypothetical protein